MTAVLVKVADDLADLRPGDVIGSHATVARGKRARAVRRPTFYRVEADHDPESRAELASRLRELADALDPR